MSSPPCPMKSLGTPLMMWSLRTSTGCWDLRGFSSNRIYFSSWMLSAALHKLPSTETQQYQYLWQLVQVFKAIPSLWLVQCKHSHGYFCKAYCRQTPTWSNSKATCLHSSASCLRKPLLWRRSSESSYIGLVSGTRKWPHSIWSAWCVGGKQAHTGTCPTGAADLFNTVRIIFLARLKPTGWPCEGKRHPFPQRRT